MSCEGLANWNGKRAWQIYFRQRADKPNKIRSYRIGLNAPSHPIALKGRAWFVADSYQIVGLQTDLIDALPDLRLTVDHANIEYGPVHFSSRGVDMWLPKTAELYCDPKGKRIHRRLSFSNYLLFAVDEKQKISAPEYRPLISSQAAEKTAVTGKNFSTLQSRAAELRPYKEKDKRARASLRFCASVFITVGRTTTFMLNAEMAAD